MLKSFQIKTSAIYTGHAGAIYDLCPGMQEQQFYSASADHFVGCWDIEKGVFDKPLAKAISCIYSMALIPEKGYMVIGTRAGLIHVIDILSRKALYTFDYHKKSVFAVLYLAEQNTWVSASEDGQFVVWDATNFTLKRTFPLSQASIRSISLSPDKKTMAVGGSDHLIRLLSIPDFEVLHVLKGHENSVFTTVFADNATLISGGRDAHIMRWKKEGENWELSQKIPAHNYTINHIAISPDQQLLATASRDKTVKIWDAGSLDLLKVLDRAKYSEAHLHSVNRLLWLDNQQLLSGGDDKHIITWEIMQS